MLAVVLEFDGWWGLIGFLGFYLVGFLHVIHALMNVRTAQGTFAWMVALFTLPFVAIPLYWLLGRTRFSGYLRARRMDDARLRGELEEVFKKLHEFKVPFPSELSFERAAEYLGGLPFTRGNDLELLIDGRMTFERIFEAIQRAEESICVCFYIVKNDAVGGELKEVLIERARAGVEVCFLFDEIGSHKLPGSYLRELGEAGVKCQSFGVNRYWWSRLQLNFRNHRKIVICDGELAFLGGFNVGDEYLGRDQRFGAWRDTHLQLRGPVVQAVQLVFLEDWYWAGHEIPRLPWKAEVVEADQVAAIIPTGPSDPADSWQLIVAEAANTARTRLWITSPYFVPDEGVLTALQTAAIRGVDVRILLPERPDHLLVWLSAFSFYEQAIPFGVRLFRYQKGFLHQKVMLMDGRLAAVGTANLDNRSFRLNFEISAFCADEKFIAEVEEMLVKDFANAYEAEMDDFLKRPFWFRAAARAARLLAPVQ